MAGYHGHNSRAPELARLLHAWRARVGITTTELARRAACNSSYISRLEHDTRKAGVSRSILESIAGGLGLSVAETDRVLVAGGYCPDWFGGAAAAQLLPALRGVMADPDTTAEARAAFCAVVCRIAEHWALRGVPVLVRLEAQQ